MLTVKCFKCGKKGHLARSCHVVELVTEGQTVQHNSKLLQDVSADIKQQSSQQSCDRSTDSEQTSNQLVNASQCQRYGYICYL